MKAWSSFILFLATTHAFTSIPSLCSRRRLSSLVLESGVDDGNSFSNVDDDAPASVESTVKSIACSRRYALRRAGIAALSSSALWESSRVAARAVEIPAFFSGQQGSWLGVFDGYGERQVRAVPKERVDKSLKSVRPTTYLVKEVNPPQLQPFTLRGERRIVTELATSTKALVLGTHGDAPADMAIVSRLLKQFVDVRQSAPGTQGRPIVLALSGAVAAAESGGGDKVESLQEAIDDFVGRGGASGGDLASAEEAFLGRCAALERREGPGDVWAPGMSARGILPILRTCRQLGGIKVAAVGIGASIVERVERRGLEALESREKAELVSDPDAFMAAVGTPGFKRYSDRIITDLYEKNRPGSGVGGSEAVSDGGIKNKRGGGEEEEKQTNNNGGVEQSANGDSQASRAVPESGAVGNKNLANFFAARILSDEVIARRAAQSVLVPAQGGKGAVRGDDSLLSDGGLLVLLTDVDRVTYGYGTHARLEAALFANENGFPVKSLLANPTAEDSLSPVSALQLTLGYGDFLASRGGGDRVLANYLLFDKSPAPKLLTRMLDAVN